MKAMKILCNIPQKEGKDFLGEIYDLRSFVPISDLSEFTHYFPPLNLVKFNPSSHPLPLKPILILCHPLPPALQPSQFYSVQLCLPLAATFGCAKKGSFLIETQLSYTTTNVPVVLHHHQCPSRTHQSNTKSTIHVFFKQIEFVGVPVLWCYVAMELCCVVMFCKNGVVFGCYVAWQWIRKQMV